MVSLQCHVCKVSNIQDVSALNLHIKICHKSCNFFECSTDQCKRTFDKWDSYRKHLLKVHKVPLRSNKTATPAVASGSHVESMEYETDKLEHVEANESDLHKVKEISVQEIKTLLSNQADVLVAKLSSKPGLPRSLVQNLIEDFTDFLSGSFIKVLEMFVSSNLDKSVEPSVHDKISDMFQWLSNPFSHLSSEYLRLKHFEASGEYIPPETYIIDSRMERIVTKEGVKYQIKDVTGQFIPLRKVFKKFFELPDALDDTLAYMSYLDPDGDVLSNFSQCQIWKTKVSKFNANQIVLPLMVYYDNFQPNNALGPHCEKLGGCYVSLPCLPPECQSKLDNIFLALLFNGDDRSLYGNMKCFKQLLEELKFLETDGITVSISGKEAQIYFVTGLILGDNLGLNGMCGFVESFNACYSCRICKAPKELSHSMVEEDLTLLRTKENYAEDINLNDTQKTGIKEKSIFCELPSSEMPCDIGVDEFHDAAEGVCHYTMVPILQHFHSQDPLFIETLNNRMYVCDLGDDSDNRPPSILPEKLVNNSKLKMTGAEMYTFIRYFGVWVWDLVRHDDQFFQLYLLLKDIVCIVNSKNLPRNAHVTLSVKVREHHKLYIALTGENLKPKHHNLVHYSRLLLLFGPFGLLSTIRFEAKHKMLKMTSNVCMSRRNLPKTVAIKQQLKLCYRFVCNESIRPKLIVGSGNILNLKELPKFSSFSLTLPDVVFNNTVQFCAKWVEFKGTKYREGHLLLSNTDENGCYQFCKVNTILVYSKQPLFICSPLLTLGYHANVGGYEVEMLPDEQNWYCLGPEDLLDPFPLCPVSMATGELIIVPKRYL